MRARVHKVHHFNLFESIDEYVGPWLASTFVLADGTLDGGGGGGGSRAESDEDERAASSRRLLTHSH